jgi:hypothetical protein
MSYEWTKPSVKALFATLAIASVTLTLPFWAQEPKPSQAIRRTQEASSARPFANLPPGPMAERATTACTECHEARIILQQRLTKAAWTKEVDKMIKWGAVVEPGDHDALIEYLSNNFNPDQPPYEPTRTSSQNSNATKISK